MEGVGDGVAPVDEGAEDLLGMLVFLQWTARMSEMLACEWTGGGGEGVRFVCIAAIEGGHIGLTSRRRALGGLMVLIIAASSCNWPGGWTVYSHYGTCWVARQLSVRPYRAFAGGLFLGEQEVLPWLGRVRQARVVMSIWHRSKAPWTIVVFIAEGHGCWGRSC